MADLLVIAFPTEAEAEALRMRLLGMQQEYLIERGDAVVAVKQADGTMNLNQFLQPVAAGAVSGALWGSLLGLIFLNPLAGAAIGAASGALGGKLTDLGINDDSMREASRTLRSGNAALFLLISRMTTDKVLAALHGVGGTMRNRLVRRGDGGGPVRGARRRRSRGQGRERGLTRRRPEGRTHPSCRSAAKLC